MRTPDYGDLCLNAKANAACALLNGGALHLFEDMTEQPPLAVLKFGTPAFALAADGRCTALAIESGAGRRDGRASWFRCFTKLGEYVYGGSCGPADSGEAFDAYLDGDVQEGGEVRVSGFVYAERRA